MICSDTHSLDNRKYLESFNEKTTLLRIPISGSIDVTSECNLNCIHCYMRKNKIENIHFSEMQTDYIFKIIDEFTEAGCLYLLITGGEPLIRRDFPDIYRHIKLNGLLVTVFSNGTTITERILDLFEEFPPQAVEVSLYGATPSTYEKITGIKGSFNQCINGIQKLMDRRIRVKLKTILMTLNRHEFSDIEKLAEDFGIPFRFDVAIFPCFNGDRKPLSLRIPPKEAVELEFANVKRRNDWNNFYKRYKNISELDFLYHCAAGVTSFHIDAYGNLKSCLMTGDPSYDLRCGNFADGWQSINSAIQKKKPKDDYACRNCNIRMLCAYCPAFFKLENGSEDIPSGYLCTMGRERFQMIQNIHERRYHESIS